jgi:DNA-binding MarR family transcriptional regulator
LTEIDGTAAGTEPDGIPQLTMGLRGLIVSGERLRNVLAHHLGLGPSDLVALGHVHNDGPLTPRELASRMEVTSGSMTALLDRVEKAGFLTRDANPHDRRSLLIRATPAGSHAMQWVYGHFNTAMRDALGQVEGFEIDQLATALTELARALEIRARSESQVAVVPRKS